MTPGSFRLLPLLLFGSGFSALAYQTIWTREFRLIFGGSTSATAAVLAVFSCGLGIGALALGRRIDRHPNPLRFYGWLELGIAASAAVSPLLLTGSRVLYLALGGTPVLGTFAGSAARLGLAFLVLALPTILMGATLPAMARAATDPSDRSRHRTALLYGINTLGAVAGVFACTFVLLERLGNRGALAFAVALNLIVAVVALERSSATLVAADGDPNEAETDLPATATSPAAPPKIVYAAAFLAGLVFFLMELVWYRMLAPILGGSVFTFGSILGVALLGIGLGGALYSVTTRRPPSLQLFGWTCLAEAAAVLTAFAMGDDLAALAGALRGLSLFGFAGLVSGWLIVTIVAVLPASLIAGFQFPLLIALLGQGRLGVGGQVANAYVANMAGGIAGSLVGGFGLLPLVSAPTTWLLCGFSLLLLAAWVFTTSSSRRLTPLVACLAVALLGALPGPTAAWRHSGLGVGRSDIESQKTRGQYLEWRQGHRRALLWEADGVESSVALRTGGGVAFVVNGKVDGHATRDSPTQVMLALVGAAFHPNPRRVMVIGLGTGSTAGWLAAIPQVEVVDVSELEPRILDVAAALRDVNEGVLTNPRVRTHVGDAREFLQTVPGEYDLIVSEPSNPYRAGIATLFSGEYYSSAIQRLAKGGLFIQWLQAYEVDQTAVEQVFATMRSRFPAVSVFRTHRDLVLIGSREPLRFGGALRRRLASEPFLRAMIVAWDVDSFAEFMARYIGGRKLVDHVADRARGLVTDDLNPLEFGFARSVGRTDAFRTGALLEESRALGDHDPAFEDEPLTPEERTLIQEAIAQLYEEPRWTAELDLEGQLRVQAVTLSKRGDVGGAGRIWRTGLRPRTMEQRLLAAEALADIGDARFPQVVATLPEFREADVAALWARAHFRRGAKQDALDAALSALSSIHVSPWADAPLFARFLQILSPIARANPGSSGRIGEALKRPFAGGALYEERISMWAQFAMDPSSGLDCREAFAYFDRAPPLTDAYRTLRTACDKISR